MLTKIVKKKLDSIFVISGVSTSFWKVFIKVRWPDEKLTTDAFYAIDSMNIFMKCCQIVCSSSNYINHYLKFSFNHLSKNVIESNMKVRKIVS